MLYSSDAAGAPRVRGSVGMTLSGCMPAWGSTQAPDVSGGAGAASQLLSFVGSASWERLACESRVTLRSTLWLEVSWVCMGQARVSEVLFARRLESFAFWELVALDGSPEAVGFFELGVSQGLPTPAT